MMAVVTTGNGGYDKLVISEVAATDGGWNEATPFPIIQGADCCGRIIAVAPGGDESRIGERVLVRACTRPNGYATMDNVWMGSDFGGSLKRSASF